jgi:hypothetical protein
VDTETERSMKSTQKTKESYFLGKSHKSRTPQIMHLVSKSDEAGTMHCAWGQRVLDCDVFFFSTLFSKCSFCTNSGAGVVRIICKIIYILGRSLPDKAKYF